MRRASDHNFVAGLIQLEIYNVSSSIRDDNKDLDATCSTNILAAHVLMNLIGYVFHTNHSRLKKLFQKIS